MSARDARAVLKYWRDCPPLHETLAVLAQAYTTWKPDSSRPKTEAEAQAMHRADLDRRWKGGAMDARQMWQAMGNLRADGTGSGQGMTGADMPGIGPFPGAVKH